MNIRAIKNGSIRRHPIASITINLKVTKGKKAAQTQFGSGFVLAMWPGPGCGCVTVTGQ